MVDFRTVRCTLTAVIILFACVLQASSKAVSIKRNYQTTHKVDSILVNTQLNEIDEGRHKHLTVLKAPDATLVEAIKKRIKARTRGRKIDQSNGEPILPIQFFLNLVIVTYGSLYLGFINISERNLWTSHPKNTEWVTPDTSEVIAVIKSLGI